jgi:hypothetical protein
MKTYVFESLTFNSPDLLEYGMYAQFWKLEVGYSLIVDLLLQARHFDTLHETRSYILYWQSSRNKEEQVVEEEQIFKCPKLTNPWELEDEPRLFGYFRR